MRMLTQLVNERLLSWSSRLELGERIEQFEGAVGPLGVLSVRVD